MKMLSHSDVWRAIDKLAANHNMSPSGLAKKSGLSPTIFNHSKRCTNGRDRWPSTESVARILDATNTSMNEFACLAAADTDTENMSNAMKAALDAVSSMNDEKSIKKLTHDFAISSCEHLIAETKALLLGKRNDTLGVWAAINHASIFIEKERAVLQ